MGNINRECSNKTYYICKGVKGNGYVGINVLGELTKICHGFTSAHSYTKITRSEMQSELAKHGKYFDLKEKVLKDLRWRAKKAEVYFFTDATFEIRTERESYHKFDNNCFEFGNYHQTKEQCEEYAQKMIEYSKSLIK